MNRLATRMQNAVLFTIDFVHFEANDRAFASILFFVCVLFLSTLCSIAVDSIENYGYGKNKSYVCAHEVRVKIAQSE